MMPQPGSTLVSVKLIVFLILFLASDILTAQDYWTTQNLPYGGSTYSIIFKSSGEAVVASSWSGVYTSGDLGENWNPLSSTAIKRLAINKDGIIFGSGIYGGIYRSDNGGQDWVSIVNGWTGNQVTALAVDSANRVYAGSASQGIFRSVDQGNNWVRMNSPSSQYMVNTFAVDLSNNLFIGTQGGGILYFSSADSVWSAISFPDNYVTAMGYNRNGTLIAATSSSIYFSWDHGATWSRVYDGSGYATSVACMSNGLIFVSTRTGLFRFNNDGGGAFQIQSVNGLSNENIITLAVDKNDQILAGTADGFESGVYRSTDYGDNWQPVIRGLTAMRIWKFAISPDGIILAGTYDSGIYRSADNGQSWQPANSGLYGYYPSHKIRGMAVNLDGWFFIATDGAGAFRSTDNGLSWIQINTGLPSNYLTSMAYFPYPGEVYTSTSANGVYKSTDNGNTWNHTGAQLDTASVEQFVMTPNATIFAGTYYDGIFRSTDFGDSWAQVATGNLVGADVFSVASNSVGDIFAATYGRGIFRSQDNGDTWTQLTQGLQGHLYFRPLVINHLDHVFAASSSAFTSENNGDNWSFITNNLSGKELNGLAVSPDGFLFAGTNHGIYRTSNSTTTLSLKFTVKMLFANGFNPSTDQVVVRGNFNNWGGAEDNVYLDPLNDQDQTWTGWYLTNRSDTLAALITDDTLRYRFVIKTSGGGNSESGIPVRRAYWDQKSDLELPVLWFGEPINDPGDSTALAVLYNSTTGSSWTHNNNWLTDRPFNKWYGLSADPEGRVNRMQLGSNNLTGTIPTAIGGLSFLRELGLEMNNLQNSIPKEIGQLSLLTYLNLYSNDLSGTIPSEIGNCLNLEVIELGANSLSGSIPASFENLTKLIDLHLFANQLSGTIPAGIWNLFNLKTLWLDMNQLTGTLPASLGNLTKLHYLSLRDNKFSGLLPVEIGNLNNLAVLELFNNQFSGAVPATLVNIDSLREVYLQMNQFYDLPDLTAAPNLKKLHVDNNRLTFEDIEHNMSIADFIYAPQDSVGVSFDTTIAQSTGLVLSASVGGSNNRYQWYLNGTEVSGANSDRYNIYTAGVSDQGTYYCAITNTVATALTLYSRPVMVTVAGVVPAITLLNAPADGTIGLPVSPTLIWNPTAGAESYQVQVCKNNTFTPPLADERTGLTGTAVQAGTLTGNTLYYWRVRASNTVGNGDWSAVWSFTTESASAPAAPVLNNPAGNAAAVSVYPALKWTAVAGTYHLQLDDNAAMTSPLFDIDTLTQQQFLVRANALQFNQQYFWRVTVTAGGYLSNWSETWGFTTESYPADIQLDNITNFATRLKPGDFLATDYRIYGIPGGSDTPLGDVLGGKAGTDWQAYWDNGQAADYFLKFDLSNTFNCDAGRAFWLVYNGAIHLSRTVASTALNAGQQAEISVHPGWNLITVPFNFPIGWDFIRQVNGITVPLWSYTGVAGWNQAASMQPYVGYYFDNSAGLGVLKIPYKSALGKTDNSDAIIWQLTISIESAGLKESCTQLGVAGDALAGRDRYDFRKPRAVGEDLPGVYFSRPEWDEGNGIFASDFRPPSESLEIWPLTVTVPAGQKAVITIEGVDNIDAGLALFLLDKEHLCYLDLRRQDNYSFTAACPRSEFEILAGDRVEIEQELKKTVPQEFVLGNNYPNPFNPLTTIPVLVPESSVLNLVVYNSLGQQVGTLFNGPVSPGRHYFTWDGRDQSGRAMASGIYFYHVSTDKGFSFTRKMVLVK